MKNFVLIITMIIGFLSTSITAQKTIWLDQNLKETTLKEAIYYKLGNQLEGKVSYYFKNKSVYRKVFFVDTKLEGKYSEFYNSGELKETGKYKNGLRTGNWKEYYKTGKIKKRGRYNAGDKVGIWKIFYKND